MRRVLAALTRPEEDHGVYKKEICRGCNLEETARVPHNGPFIPGMTCLGYRKKTQ